MLEFNGTFIILAISFVIFVALENVIFYRPLKKILRERADYIKGNETFAGESYTAMQSLIAQKDEKIAKAREKSSVLLNDTNAKAQEEFDIAIKEAKQNSNKYLNETQVQLEEEKIQVKNELKKEIGIYASDIISKILKKDISVININDEVVEKALRGEL